ncbi:MAG TPA: GNAT family N-acetyltransferase [Chitinophagaceae bacterium]|nr:GNAT family N-acetyltransferase [Chitinophagaceae bacterium]
MDNELIFRLATKDDIEDIVQMLLDDPLGATRENVVNPLSERYLRAFEKINADPNQELTIVEMNGNKVATFQLTFIQGLTHHGGMRAQIEAVRTHAAYRGEGIGTRVFKYVIERARQKGCVLVQLTSDKRRPRAIKFYEALGFAATHEGMKLKL